MGKSESSSQALDRDICRVQLHPDPAERCDVGVQRGLRHHWTLSDVDKKQDDTKVQIVLLVGLLGARPQWLSAVKTAAVSAASKMPHLMLAWISSSKFVKTEIGAQMETAQCNEKSQLQKGVVHQQEDCIAEQPRQIKRT